MTLKIDIKNKKILSVLDLDARAPVSGIAKKVRLSKQLVSYRIRQLEKEKVIEGYYAVINISKLGYLFYRVFLRFNSTDNEKEEEIINYLKSLPNVAWIVSTDGRWDLAVLTWAKDVLEFNLFLEKLSYKYGRYLTNKYVTIVTAIYHFKHKFLFDKNDYTLALVGGDINKTKLDNIDLQIIGILAFDGRVSLLDISKKLRNSPKVIAYRIKKLINTGIILAFRAKLNTQLLGYHHYKVFLTLNNLTEEIQNKFITFCRQHPNIIYVTKAVGEYDIEFELQAQNNEEFHKIFREVKYNFSDIITDYESLLVFYENQINYLPGHIEL